MAKRGPKPKPDQATGPQEPDAKPPLDGTAAHTGAAIVAPVNQTGAVDMTPPVVPAPPPPSITPLEPQAPVAKAPKPKTVVVTGPARGRWRIVRHFTPEPVSIAESDLTETEIEALQGDPTLTVEIIDAPY